MNKTWPSWRYRFRFASALLHHRSPRNSGRRACCPDPRNIGVIIDCRNLCTVYSYWRAASAATTHRPCASCSRNDSADSGDPRSCEKSHWRPREVISSFRESVRNDSPGPVAFQLSARSEMVNSGIPVRLKQRSCRKRRYASARLSQIIVWRSWIGKMIS